MWGASLAQGHGGSTFLLFGLSLLFCGFGTDSSEKLWDFGRCIPHTPRLRAGGTLRDAYAFYGFGRPPKSIFVRKKNCTGSPAAPTTKLQPRAGKRSERAPQRAQQSQ